MDKSKEFTTVTLLVTPEWAEQRLAALEKRQESGEFRQRFPKERMIARFARDLKAGKWKLTHQGIAFSGEPPHYGDLLDGQNRLWAVARSRTSALMKVSYNVPPEVMSDIDNGASRSVTDVLKISYEYSASAAAEMTVVARNILNMVKNSAGADVPDKASDRSVLVSPDDVLWVMRDLGYQEHLDRFVTIVPRKKKRLGSLAATWCWYHALRPKLADQLAREYETLEELKKGSPSLALFNFFNVTRTKRYQSIQLLQACANAIQFFDEEQTVAQLFPSREALLWLVRLNKEHMEKICKRCQF